MRKFFIFLLLTFLTVDFSTCQSVSPISTLNYLAMEGDCSYFETYEKNKNCGSNSFGVAIGVKYCKNLEFASKDFTDDGKKWINETKKCIMRKISGLFNLKCDAIEMNAYDFILSCALNPGNNAKSFCDIALNWSTLKGLLQIYDFNNPLSLDGLSKVWNLVGTCSS